MKTATISAIASGTVLGWTSPIFIDDGNHKYKYNDIQLDNSEVGWVGSFATLGALLTCFPTGILCDKIGRRMTLLTLTAPFLIGWALIIWANSIIMLYLGRFITGLAVGACCVAAPIYTSEIAQTEIRGTLGSYFQLMITVGVFYAYLVGKFLSPFWYTLTCGIIPIIFCVLFFFQPETPHYLIKKSNYEKAKEALQKLRGKNFNVDSELRAIESSIKNSSNTSISIISSLKKKSNIKAIIIAFCLMFFQQFGGINAVIFYTGDIFKKSEMSLSPQDGTIMVGAFQALATFLSSNIVDRLGRKILLLLSGFIMALSEILLGIFFTLQKSTSIDRDVISNISFLPVVSLCIFVIVFSLGYGPIPWMISSEIFTPELKGIISSAAGTFNWFLAFIVTKFYGELATKVGQDSTFYGFAVISLVGVVFVYFFVIETKGKTAEEIQNELQK